jgi:beta-galactosidase
VPTADAHVTFSISGPGRILGVGNGDPTSHEPDRASERSLFRGLAQVIIQTTPTPGTIRLEARAEGLRTAKLEIIARSAPLRSFVPPARHRHWISDWRVSPTSSSRLDSSQVVSDSDMNTWERVKLTNATEPPRVPAGQYAIYRATFAPPKIVQSRGGALIFHEIIGAADVLLDGAHIATKSGFHPDKLTFPLPPALRSVTLSLLVHAPESSPGGVTRGVELVPNEPSGSPSAGGSRGG